MTSQKQIAANRRNAAKSTGPRTPAGKFVASRNAADHGLTADRLVLRDEDCGRFNALAAGMLRDLAPVGPVEETLAERIIGLTWRLRRAEDMETAAMNVLGQSRDVINRADPCFHPIMRESIVRTMNSALNRGDNRRFRKALNELKAILDDRTMPKRQTLLGCIAVEDFKNANVLDRLMRYQARLERRLDKTLTQLQKRQQSRHRNVGERQPPQGGFHPAQKPEGAAR
jgi:hypothetical protein